MTITKSMPDRTVKQLSYPYSSGIRYSWQVIDCSIFEIARVVEWTNFALFEVDNVLVLKDFSSIKELLCISP